MGNKEPSGKLVQGVPEDIVINNDYNVDIVDESIDLGKYFDSEQSPSGGFRFVMWEMRIRA